jgi:type IV pilus assembly protein PilM
MQKTRTAIGLDIGAHSVKAVRFVWTPQSLRVEQALAAEIPDNLEDDAEARAEWLRDLLAPLKGRGARATLAVSGSICNVQLVKFPKSSDSQLKRMVSLEALCLAGLSGQDVAHDFIAVGGNSQTESPVLIALCRASAIEQQMKLATQAGLSVEEVTLPNLALHNAFTHKKEKHAKGLIAYVDIGHESTNVALSHNGELRFARSFASGGGAFTNAVMHAAQLSRAEAERWKRQYGQLFLEGIPEGAKEAALLEAAETWLKEFNETLAHFFEQSAGEFTTCDHIVLSGGGAMLRQFPDWIRDKLTRPVEVLAPLKLLGADTAALADEAKIDPRYAVAAGLALQGLKLSPSLSLLPNPVKERRVVRHRTQQLAVYSAMAALIFLTLLLAVRIQLGRVNERLAEQRKNLIRCQEIAQAIERHRNQTQHVLVKLQPVADLANRADRLLTVWRDVTAEQRGNDWFTLFADAESYYSPKRLQQGAQPPVVPFGGSAEANPSHFTPQPAIIIVEGYTTDMSFKTVEGMVKALSDKSKYPYFKKVDTLAADKRVSDEKADLFWQSQAKVRRFTLELQLDWTRIPERPAARAASVAPADGSMARPASVNPVFTAQPAESRQP